MTFPSVSAPSRRRGPTSQVLVGLMVVAVGVLFTLDNLDILDAEASPLNAREQRGQLGADVAHVRSAVRSTSPATR